MSTGEVLYWCLMGLVLVWAADMFRVWPILQKKVEDWWRRLRQR